MDEDYYNERMSEDHERIAMQAKAFTRGCGLLFLIIALFVALICLIF